MPELPEVEVTRLSFADRIAGARIVELRLGKPLRWPLGTERSLLAGREIKRVDRRGKYLLMHLDSGCLIWHLGMSGALHFAPRQPPAGTHDHVDLITHLGTLRLHDPRRFGALVYVPDLSHPRATKLLGHLGVEPLGPQFDPLSFHLALRGRRAPIKQVLLAGDVVVGVGNIYASEALYQAGIRPTTPALRISRPRALRLQQAIVAVLSRALQVGGSTLRDFSNARGESGYFQLEMAVYDRAGEPCPSCAAPIRQIRQGQRSTFYCPKCQKP
jgi:formamidopyrimidine-DNA glycosylase